MIHIIERHLQQCLNKLADWADTNGFKFSPSKTVRIHFCKLRIPHPEPTLLLNGTPVPVVEETKFLGVVFDRKLSFSPHIKHLKDKCTKALNLLRVLSHTSWGADQETLLHLYRSLIRSKLDYGCIVYGSARGTYLRMLDPIQNHALRLCLGAYRTSPASSLCVEANETPLYFRRKKTFTSVLPKLNCNYSNPAYATVFNSKFHSVFERKPTQLLPLEIRVSGDLQAVGFKKSDVITSSIPSTPPWLLARPAVNFTLHCSDKSNTSRKYSNIVFMNSVMSSRIIIAYLLMAKEGNRVAAAVLHRDNTKCVRLPDAASIFRAELYAFLLAIDVVRRSNEKNFVIFSDSMSSLQRRLYSGFRSCSKVSEGLHCPSKKWQKHYSLLDSKSCENPR